MPETARKSRHLSASEKGKAVLRVLKGEGVAQVAADAGVSVGRLERWEQTFLSAGLDALKNKPQSRTFYQAFQTNAKFIYQWVGLFLLLAATVIFLVRFMNRDSGE